MLLLYGTFITIALGALGKVIPNRGRNRQSPSVFMSWLIRESGKGDVRGITEVRIINQ